MEQSTTTQFNKLNFLNTAYKNLPVEEEIDNNPRKVRGYFFSRSKTSQKENPQIAALSQKSLQLLDMDQKIVEKEQESIEIMAGNKTPKEGIVLASCYCGYQFGNWAGQLGDGRAHILGDIQNKKGEIWELQLKGSGQTPYSRFADGNAVIRSSVREFLCSEAMHALGIPTTRAASLIVTDTTCDRDKLYTGNVIKERTAVVLRLSPTFLRFGSFQVCINIPGEPGPSVLKEKEMLPQLLDYTIQFHYKNIWDKFQKVNKSQDFSQKQDMYLEFYSEVVRKTAIMVAKWQSVGFVHGVLNTDNMSILGLTIDYGPFEFIDHYSHNHVGNHSDKGGRYSYKNQPEMCMWNLDKLADALDPIISKQLTKTFLNQNYNKIYRSEYYRLFRGKLGLQNELEKEDKNLIESMFELMNENMSEFTNTFLELKNIDFPKQQEDNLTENNKQVIEKLVKLSPNKEFLLMKKKPIASLDKLFGLQKMGVQNPMQLQMLGVDEEWVQNELEKAIAYEELQELDQQQLNTEFRKNWEKWVLKYQNRLNQDLEVSGSENFEEFVKRRQEIMENSNPKIVLRNYIAEEIIKSAENNDFKPLKDALKIFQNPFQKFDENSICQINETTPVWAAGLCVSCSS